MRPLYIICLNINYKINTNILLQALVPDELFYGMEKYNLRKFFSLSNMKIEKSFRNFKCKI